MKIADNMLELVGNTPLVKINKLNNGVATVVAKIESKNPAGSVKDRPALNMIMQAEKEGLIKEVEAMKTAAEQVLNSVEHQKEIVEKSSELLTELNPIFKEKQDTEKRFNKIENDVSEMKTMLTSFIREFKQ